MIIDRNLRPYLVHEQESIASALRHVVNQKGNIACIVNDSNHLLGIFTNGDFLRWVSQEHQPDLNRSVQELMKTRFIYASLDEPPERIEDKLEQVNYVPIVDGYNRLVAVARQRTPDFIIDGFEINADSPTFVIAEIGNNHNGSLELAFKLIDEAQSAGAHCAKFQMRHMNTLYHGDASSQDAGENLGAQYTMDLLERFQLEDEELFRAFDYCKSKRILPLCTPWDESSLASLERYGMPAYKVASADLTNHDLLKALTGTGKPLICSTGMSTESEIQESVNLLQKAGAQYALLHCNSTYPAPFKDIHLNYIPRLAEIGQCHVGYSGHERDVFVAVAAVAKGAKIIERHFTLDKSMEGNDHKISLLPREFKQMIAGIQQIDEALGIASTRNLSQGEMMNRVTLAKSLISNREINAGEIIRRDMIAIKSPGRGLQPNRLDDLVGTVAGRDFKAGDFFFPSDLEGKTAQARAFQFKHAWGLPVRYHDLANLLEMVQPDLVEFHLSYNDLNLDYREFLSEALELDFVVHCPELFAGEHTLDLCSTDEAYRQQSIAEVQRVINLTRNLKPYFKGATRPLIVTNVGGFTKDGFLSPDEVQHRYELFSDSLKQLERDGVELIPQTMPPFPWHFGGQQFHNLFVRAGEIVALCEQENLRICLDLSHSKLACNYYNQSFKAFLEQVAPYTAHLHIADAIGDDSEGLQIGEGHIDFASVASVINELAPGASFIPEIWQGHENNGAGFWLALDRLEGYF